MENYKKIEWVLRLAVAGEFVGHGGRDEHQGEK